jgi:hypothetical protein
LACRPCGTNAQEVGAAIRKPDDYARRWLLSLSHEGRLFKALDPGNKAQQPGLPVVQFFGSQAAADAWLALPVSKRPNVRLRTSKWDTHHKGHWLDAVTPPDRVLRAMHAAATKRAHLEATRNAVVPAHVKVQVIPHQADTRVALTAQERASARCNFSAVGVGRYLLEASSCAARAVR